MAEQNNELNFLAMEEVKLSAFTEDMQQKLKSAMDFMIDFGIVEIKRWGEDRELSLRYVDGVVYSVGMDVKE